MTKSSLLSLYNNEKHYRSFLSTVASQEQLEANKKVEAYLQ